MRFSRRAAHVSDVLHAPCQRRPGRGVQDRSARRRNLAGELQGRRVRPRRRKLRVRPEQHVHVLARLDGAHEENRACAVIPIGASPRGRARWTQRNAIARYGQLRCDQPGRVLRHRDDSVGLPRVPGSEGWVVAADLRGRAFRMLEEIQVVHGDDPGGAPCRHQQGMHRMRHVNGAGEGLGRRPLESMPAQVEKADRHPRIDDRHARNHAGRQPVLPRAGKERQRIAGRQLAGEGRGQFVRVLADACAFAQGGPIVDEDPHARPMLASASSARLGLGTANPFESID